MRKVPVPEENLSVLTNKMKKSKIKYLALLKDMCADGNLSEDLYLIVAEAFVASRKYADIIELCEKEETEEGKILYYLSRDESAHMIKTILVVNNINKKMLEKYNYSLASH